MRELLEYLGLVDPEPGRREPVALPAWSRFVGSIAVAALAAASLLILATVRALIG
jgi:hypothetical protein